jgi:hypothetical protein
MFKPSTPLPLLQTMEVDVWPADLFDDTVSFGRTRFSNQDLQLLVQCCTGLRDLQLGAALRDCADVSPLMQLQQLTALSVCFKLDEQTAQGLAVLTGLEGLTIHIVDLPAVALAWLTKLQNLNTFTINADCFEDPDRGFQQISEELLKHPEVNRYRLHLKTRSVSCRVQCQRVHPCVGARVSARALLPSPTRAFLSLFAQATCDHLEVYSSTTVCGGWCCVSDGHGSSCVQDAVVLCFHAMSSNFHHALQEGTEPRVWQQLLRICQGSEACRSIMLQHEQTGAHHPYLVLRCLFQL